MAIKHPPPEPQAAALEPYVVSVHECARIEDCGRSVVYERLARGEYEALKDGSRTKIIFESIKRRRAGLPRATFKPPIPRRQTPDSNRRRSR